MKMLVYAVVAGVVITLLTGLIGNTPEIGGQPLMGAVYFGYPFVVGDACGGSSVFPVGPPSLAIDP